MKPIIVSVPCGTNSVSAKDFLVADGSGAVKANTDAGVDVLGVALTDKDGDNNVAMVKQGLMKLTVAHAEYKVGDALELATGGQKLKAKDSGVAVAEVMETKTLASDGELLVYLNL